MKENHTDGGICLGVWCQGCPLKGTQKDRMKFLSFLKYMDVDLWAKKYLTHTLKITTTATTTTINEFNSEHLLIL